MISLDPLHPIQSAIIEILAEQPKLNTDELLENIRKKYHLKLGKANLYRVLGQMAEKQIIAKSAGKISLHQAYVSTIRQFFDNLRENYINAKLEMNRFRLNEGERREFFADSIETIDPEWGQVLMTAIDESSEKIVYKYNTHPWHALGMRYTETRLYEAYVREGMTMKLVYSSNTFLDRYGAKIINVPGTIIKIDENGPFQIPGYCLNLCGDYIIEIFFPDQINRHFEIFFQTVQAIDQFDLQLFSDIFKMKSRCKLSVRKSKKDAQVLREKFEIVFGKPIY